MSPTTRRQYERLLARFAAFQANGVSTGLPDQIRAWLTTLTPNMGRLGYQALRLAYGPQVPWHEIRKPRARRNEARLQTSILSTDERERLRDAVTSPREWALLELFWTLRRAEAARAHWRDIDLGQGLIYVVGKGGKPSWTLLPEPTQVALAEWYRATDGHSDDSPIFPGRRPGQSLAAGTVSNIVRRLLRRAGIYRPGRGAHAFRRTMATEYLLENKGDLDGLQVLLRHESITTTGLYRFYRPADLRPRLDRVRL